MTPTKEKTLVVIPAFNESMTIDNVLKDLYDAVNGTLDIVVIDDGSTDITQEIAKRRVRVVRHFLNRGLGAALMTGIEIARRGGYDKMATYDGDGQHHPTDLLQVLSSLNHTADLIVGSRFMGQSIKRMPFAKRFGNNFLNLVTRVFYRVKITDSQSGLRALNRKAIESIQINADRYDVSTRILASAQEHGLRIKEVPIHTIYTDHSESQGTAIIEGIKIFLKVLEDVFNRN